MSVCIILFRTQGESSDSDSQFEGRNGARGEDLHLPVQCLGRQSGSDVFVLGPSLQFWSSGEAIPPEQQQYVWIPYILKKLKMMDAISPIDQLPTVHNPMKKVVKGLRKISGDNFPSSLFVLGETQSNSFQGRDTHVTMYTDVYMVALVCVDIHAGA